MNYMKNAKAKTFNEWLIAHARRSKCLMSATEMPELPALPDWCKELPIDERTMEYEVNKWIAGNPRLIRWLNWILRHSRLIVFDKERKTWRGNRDWLKFHDQVIVAIDNDTGQSRKYSSEMLNTHKPPGVKTSKAWYSALKAATGMSHMTFYRLRRTLPKEQRSFKYQPLRNAPKPIEEPPRYSPREPIPHISIPALLAKNQP